MARHGLGASSRPYRGRFAPTPSGPLHLGSLLTATASWLDARAHNGLWRVRIDDGDAPRVVPGAESSILATLEVHGLTWDGPLARQSDHAERYRAALVELAERCYACRCTRRQLRGKSAYPGTCRNRALPKPGSAIRLRVDRACIRFDDRIQGVQRADLARSGGDFIVQRRDGIPSYPFAVVVDDDAMAINQVVRGADLLDNVPQQLHVMRCLGKPPPTYAHLPVIADAKGEKLSKHNAATALDSGAASQNLATVLSLLGLDCPLDTVPAMLDTALRQWHSAVLPTGLALTGFAAMT